MGRLNNESLAIMKDIIVKARSDYKDMKFMWAYNSSLGSYCLLYKVDNGVNNFDTYEFESELNKKYNMTELAMKFMEMNCKWLYVESDDNDIIKGDVDLIETEIIVNEYEIKF